jgi:hypothetical protein
MCCAVRRMHGFIDEARVEWDVSWVHEALLWCRRLVTHSPVEISYSVDGAGSGRSEQTRRRLWAVLILAAGRAFHDGVERDRSF